jgi:hypothetical protein
MTTYQKSEIGNPHTKTREVSNLASGLWTPPFFALSRVKSQVCTGTNRNIKVTPTLVSSGLYNQRSTHTNAEIEICQVRPNVAEIVVDDKDVEHAVEVEEQ